MKQITKDHILDSFNRLLRAYQFEEITVKMIMEESGVSRSTFYRYYFDKYDVTAADQGVLRGQAQWLNQYPARTVTIEGHCDERGGAGAVEVSGLPRCKERDLPSPGHDSKTKLADGAWQTPPSVRCGAPRFP